MPSNPQEIRSFIESLIERIGRTGFANFITPDRYTLNGVRISSATQRRIALDLIQTPEGEQNLIQKVIDPYLVYLESRDLEHSELVFYEFSHQPYISHPPVEEH